MRVGSLFTGIGGLDLGFERAGFEVAWQCEIDPYCRAVLAQHWPDVPCYEDVRTIGPDVEPEPVDVIVGGFPCQPVSVAGKRAGQDDERWLWPEFARVVRLLRPRYVAVENVPGLLVRGMGDVLGDLAACGFDAEWDSVSAASVGAPHIRDRVFIVAYANGGGREPRGERGRVVSMAGRGPDDAGATAQSGAGVADTEGVSGELRASARERPGRPTSGSAAAHVADSGRVGVEPQRTARQMAGPTRAGAGEASKRERLRDAAGSRGEALADTTRLRRGQPRQRTVDGGPSCGGDERQRAERPEAVADSEVFSVRPGLCACDTRGERWGRPCHACRARDAWATEPDVGRVAHGIPARVDRLRALGNAVVPQVAEVAARRILALEEAMKGKGPEAGGPTSRP